MGVILVDCEAMWEDERRHKIAITRNHSKQPDLMIGCLIFITLSGNCCFQSSGRLDYTMVLRFSQMVPK